MHVIEKHIHSRRQMSERNTLKIILLPYTNIIVEFIEEVEIIM